MGRTGMLYDVVGSIKPIEVLPLGGKIGRDDRECQMHVKLLNPEITKSNKVICKRYRAVSKVHAKIYYSSVKSSWVIEDADSKIHDLTSKINLISKLEKRINDLNLIAEDVNVKIKNLKNEEYIINRAGNQIAELKFLLGKMEKE